MDQNQHMMGRDPEPRTFIDNRVWFGSKLALWRSQVAWEIAVKQAAEIVARCSHMTGCSAESVETEMCLPDCPDREIRLSALVVLNAARQFAPINALKVTSQSYTAPSREYFSDIVAQLAACQAELEALRGTVITMPPENDPPKLKE